MLLGAVLHPRLCHAHDAFADAVHSYTPGMNGGFGADLLPGIILGPPRGTGLVQGSFDVLALGIGGSIVLRFDLPVMCDGPGPDFTVFENAFHSGSPSGPIFAEYGFVAVSQDGVRFVEFPYDPVTHRGLAGQTPVLSNAENDIDPLDPAASGGDGFDLAAVGLSWAAFVRITDVAGTISDPGDLPQFTAAPNAGFDLDAVAALHACDPSAQATLTPTATIVPATATPTRTRAPSMPGDLDGDGSVTEADALQLVAEIFDGDGDAASAVGGGSTLSTAEADVNGDARITAADLAALAALRASRAALELPLPTGEGWGEGDEMNQIPRLDVVAAYAAILGLPSPHSSPGGGFAHKVRQRILRLVIPAQAGIQAYGLRGQVRRFRPLLKGRDRSPELMRRSITWIPAFAGMTEVVARCAATFTCNASGGRGSLLRESSRNGKIPNVGAE